MLVDICCRKRRAAEREGAINGRAWIALTFADAVIWVIAEVQIGTAAFVPARYGGPAVRAAGQTWVIEEIGIANPQLTRTRRAARGFFAGFS